MSEIDSDDRNEEQDDHIAMQALAAQILQPDKHYTHLEASICNEILHAIDWTGNEETLELWLERPSYRLKKLFSRSDFLSNFQTSAAIGLAEQAMVAQMFIDAAYSSMDDNDEVPVVIDDADRLGYADQYSAGMDIALKETVSLPPGVVTKVDLQFSISIPPTCYGLLSIRSSWSNRLLLNAGVIDSGYTGSVHAQLWNFSPDVVEIPAGSSPVQIIFNPFMRHQHVRVPLLKPTIRGAGGFGSSGSSGGAKRAVDSQDSSAKRVKK